MARPSIFQRLIQPLLRRQKYTFPPVIAAAQQVTNPETANKAIKTTKSLAAENFHNMRRAAQQDLQRLLTLLQRRASNSAQINSYQFNLFAQNLFSQFEETGTTTPPIDEISQAIIEKVTGENIPSFDDFNDETIESLRKMLIKFSQLEELYLDDADLDNLLEKKSSLDAEEIKEISMKELLENHRNLIAKASSFVTQSYINAFFRQTSSNLSMYSVSMGLNPALNFLKSNPSFLTNGLFARVIYNLVAICPSIILSNYLLNKEDPSLQNYLISVFAGAGAETVLGSYLDIKSLVTSIEQIKILHLIEEQGIEEIFKLLPQKNPLNFFNLTDQKLLELYSSRSFPRLNSGLTITELKKELVLNDFTHLVKREPSLLNTNNPELKRAIIDKFGKNAVCVNNTLLAKATLTSFPAAISRNVVLVAALNYKELANLTTEQGILLSSLLAPIATVFNMVANTSVQQVALKKSLLESVVEPFPLVLKQIKQSPSIFAFNIAARTAANVAAFLIFRESVNDRLVSEIESLILKISSVSKPETELSEEQKNEIDQAILAEMTSEKPKESATAVKATSLLEQKEKKR